MEWFAVMQDAGPSDEIIAMVVSARANRGPIAVTAASRLKGDLKMYRREMRPFLAAYRARFGIGPTDEKQFLLRHFDTHWAGSDQVKDLWLRGRCMVSSDFEINWERFDRADVTVDHFIQCAVAGVWRPPEVPQLPDDVIARYRKPIVRILDAIIFVVALIAAAVIFVMIAGTLAVIAPVIIALAALILFLSYRNYRQEVRARRD